MYISRETLQQTGCFFTDEVHLAHALQRRGGTVQSLEEAVEVIGNYFDEPGLIWTISGSGNSELDYTPEQEGLGILFDHASKTEKPVLIGQGGAEAGITGTSSRLAAKHTVPAMGFAPFSQEGIGGLGPNPHNVIWGRTFRDCEDLASNLGDIWIGIGDSKDTGQGCRAALRAGSAIMIFSLQEHSKSTRSWSQRLMELKSMRAAQENGQLVVCTSLEDVPQKFEEALAFAGSQQMMQRATRLAAFTELLFSEARSPAT